MRRWPTLALTLVVVTAAAASAQPPHGAIVGTIRDGSAAVVPRARVLIVNDATGLLREVRSSDHGEYAAPALPPGFYHVAAEAAGFRRIELTIHVQVGATSVLDLTLMVGDVSETLSVTPAALASRERHQVDGVVTRAQIEGLPLNGRSFLELAKLEPGITSPVRGTNNRMFLAVLGSGVPTIPRVSHARVTMDGASLATMGGPGTVLQVSQEAVDEFRIATAGFDAATGQTSNAVNIVTRAGGNRLVGTGFGLYRGNEIAAYPGLVRDATDADPFFRRIETGLSVGGPILPGRVFFFASYERTDQDGVVAVRPRPRNSRRSVAFSRARFPGTCPPSGSTRSLTPAITCSSDTATTTIMRSRQSATTRYCRRPGRGSRIGSIRPSPQ